MLPEMQKKNEKRFKEVDEKKFLLKYHLSQ